MIIARLEVWGEVDPRGAIRFKADSDTTLRGPEGQPLDVRVDNFSRTGFLFEADLELPAGTLVAVGLSGAGTREAQVIWRDGQRHGCEFLVPLPASMMAKAFKGQSARIADLEAEIERRRAEAEAAAVVEPVANGAGEAGVEEVFLPPASRWRRFVAAVRGFFRP